MLRPCLLLCMTILVLGWTRAASAQAASPLTPIESFLGVNQCGDFAGMRAMGVGWERFHVEPNNGWGPDEAHPALTDFAEYDKKVMEAKRCGARLLPILGYVQPWAGFTDDYEFDYKGIHYTIKVVRDEKSPRGYRRTRIGVDPATGKEVSRKELDGSRISPRRELWEAYVEALVARYSKPPFNIRYWQIWNEGTMESGAFWDENIENYVDNIHIPAARIIRKYGGKVVWGGWPCSHWQGGQYAKALQIDNCGELTDILCAHYMQGLRWFERGAWSGNVYQEWVATGKAQGCWQTEHGWGFAVNSLWTPRFFFQDLGWALAHDWNHKDKYRNYFFHYGAPQENYGFYWNGPEPKWPNGYSIRTLMKVTRGDLALPGEKRKIEVENGYAYYADDADTSRPILCGGRLVFFFRPSNADQDGSAHVSVALKPGEKVKSVYRTTVVKGAVMPVRFEVRSGELHFDLPWLKTALTEQEIDKRLSPHCYVTVECKQPMRAWG